MMEFFSTEALVALLTLTSLEVVLGIDNVIFIAILAGKLPESERDYARKMGLLLAVVSRGMLVLAIGIAGGRSHRSACLFPVAPVRHLELKEHWPLLEQEDL